MASVKVKLDQAAVNKMLKGRGGDVARVQRGFAGQITKDVKQVANQRVQSRSGAYLGGLHTRFVSPTSFEVRGDADHSIILEEGSRPHVIVPRRAKVLRFVARSGAVVFTQRVQHPGTRAYHIIRDGVAAAARRYWGASSR